MLWSLYSECGALVFRARGALHMGEFPNVQYVVYPVIQLTHVLDGHIMTQYCVQFTANRKEGHTHLQKHTCTCKDTNTYYVCIQDIPNSHITAQFCQRWNINHVWYMDKDMDMESYLTWVSL